MRNLLIIFCLLIFQPSDAQNYQLKEVISITGQELTTDNLGNWFVINNDQIVKFRDENREPYFYSNKRLGKITSVDATNPLKVLVFYRDFSKIVFLDNTLSESGPTLLLQDLELEQASVVCSTFDNGFWVFDQQNFLLIRFNNLLKESVRIKNLHMIVNRTVEPNFMLEFENRLYMNDPKSGILVFDIFGTYYKTIPIKSLKKFQVMGNFIYYINEKNEFRWYDMKLLNDELIKIPTQPVCCEARVEKNKLFIFKNDSLHIFGFDN
jgi:hypothetical protein